MSEFDEVMRQKAVALKYAPDKNSAPVIVASGMGYMAQKITETAMEAGIPVYEDDSLASLLLQLKLGAEVPSELYQAIVDIYVYFLQFSMPEEKRITEEAHKEAKEESQQERQEEENG